MDNFVFQNPTKLIFGEGQLQRLPKELNAYGKRVLLVYGGGSIKRNGLYDELIKIFADNDFKVTEMAGVEPNPRLSTAKRGADLCKEHNIDVIVAAGGGSVIDCTKLIASAAKYDGNPWDFVMGKERPKEALPFGTILTLTATSSEMNAGSVITNEETQEKYGWGGPQNYPKFSILDPAYTLTVPIDQTVNGIVDTMSHIFEQYFHTADQAPFQDAMCEAALRQVMEIGGKLVKDPDNLELREAMMMAGVWGLNGFLSMGTRGDWGTHDIEHAISAVYDIPHAGGLAILFPHWMKQTYTRNPKRYVQLAVNVFDVDPAGKTDEEIAKEGVDRLSAFWKQIGAPSSLADYEIDDSKLELIADKAAVNGPLGGYAKLSRDEVLELLKTCL
ncbi:MULTISPECIES: iron-containing alcohol dehydrogenase [unclassified Sporosarcina]|uniref:iron-containing alcohol dehydrogenase n=1 Tax=unclassified Sporosarcina TaxID=2647733 RepID=UPI0020414093|nr:MULTISPECIES: iron-containing alcohol dehydrogenase [unclassified Sporosarcina]GKV66590.1 putative NADH-dependent butanol dehydrogenase 1 [Sporosarcina sp. NCCP-2331]GLB56926.1 putative NADH-dependent butanol dehydrogenase 1 [Sporosarcina sp. NCCP-2378]